MKFWVNCRQIVIVAPQAHKQRRQLLGRRPVSNCALVARFAAFCCVNCAAVPATSGRAASRLPSDFLEPDTGPRFPTRLTPARSVRISFGWPVPHQLTTAEFPQADFGTASLIWEVRPQLEVPIHLTRAMPLAASSSSGSTWTSTSDIWGNPCCTESSTRWAMRCPSRTESSPLTMMCRST